MGRPELTDDPRFATHVARGDNQDEIDAIVADWVAQHTGDEVYTTLTDAGVVAGPVNTVADVVADPQFLARDSFVAHHDDALDVDVRGPAPVPRLSESPGGVRWAGRPTPGADNAEVYAELLGLDAGELGRLRERGTI